MCVVYATGAPRYFEFAKTKRGEKAPTGATIFATCDGQYISELLDEYLFDAMTDGEYYELKDLVGEIRDCEYLGRDCPYRKASQT